MPTVKEIMDMTGRRVLITGASGWLGQTMADTLAEFGAELVIVDQHGETLNNTANALRERWPVNVMEFVCDLEAADQRAALMQMVNKRPLHVLVNNAAFVGTSCLKGWAVPFEQQSIDSWRRALEVNLSAVFDLCQGLAPLLRTSGRASIVNIASIYGEFGPDWRLYDGTAMANPAAYATSKGGLIQLTRWLATTLAPSIRVNSISPGGIARGQPESFIKRYEDRTPLGRMASENDFRGAIIYLASDMSGYVTGHNLRVDGGWSSW